MILTDPAILAFAASRESAIDRLKNLLKRPNDQTQVETFAMPLATEESLEVLTPPVTNRPAPSLWRNWQLPTHLTATERRARAAALKGYAQARNHDFAGAHESFLDALLCDPLLDLSQLPDFKLLPRDGHSAMIAAYEDSGQNAMAARLTATFRHTFRPRLVVSRRTPTLENSSQ